MEELKIFENPEFGQVRTIDLNEKIYFVASDVAKALGYKDTTSAIKQHCRWVVKHHIPHPQSKNKTIEVNAIPEGDLYRLITNSELPTAEKFESWIFDEVIPSIRMHGAYMTPETIEKTLTDPDFIIQLATKLMNEQQARLAAEQQIEQDKPKVIFADSVTASKTSILIGEFAKVLKQNGIDIGQNRLFEWLRTNGYLINRHGTDYNKPTQRSMELGLFEIKETTIGHGNGDISISITPKLTGKGQTYFIEKFLHQAIEA